MADIDFSKLRKLSAIFGSNATKIVNKLKSTYDAIREKLKVGKSKGGVPSHIADLDPVIRAKIEDYLVTYVIGRFEDISTVPLSKSWAKKKKYMAMKALGGNAEFPITKAKTYKGSLGVTYGSSKGGRKSGRTPAQYKYYIRVRDYKWKRILPQNVPKFGQASGFLKDVILDSLKSHTENEVFKAWIEITQANNKRSFAYKYKIHPNYFYKCYPKFLDLLLLEHGRGGLKLMPEGEDKKKVEQIGHELLTEMFGAAVSTSPVANKLVK